MDHGPAATTPEGRALTGPEILATTPELTRWAKEPRLVSALVADAAKIGDDSVRRNTIKDILAVAGGDMGALDRLQASKAAIINVVRHAALELAHDLLELLDGHPELVVAEVGGVRAGPTSKISETASGSTPKIR